MARYLPARISSVDYDPFLACLGKSRETRFEGVRAVTLKIEIGHSLMHLLMDPIAPTWAAVPRTLLS